MSDCISRPPVWLGFLLSSDGLLWANVGKRGHFIIDRCLLIGNYYLMRLKDFAYLCNVFIMDLDWHIIWYQNAYSD